MSDRHNAELVRTIGKTSVLRAMGVAAVAVVGACSGGDHWEGGVADVEVIEIASEAPAADPGKLTVCSATMETVTVGPPGAIGETYLEEERYYFDVLSRDLDASRELREVTGLSTVNNCEAARTVTQALHAPVSNDDSDPSESIDKIANAVQPVTARNITWLKTYDTAGNLKMSCTATVLSPTVLLTAAHCLKTATGSFQAWTHTAGGPFFPTPGTWTQITAGKVPATLVIHPNWSGTSDNKDDVGLVLSSQNMAVTNDQAAVVWGEVWSMLGDGVTSPIFGWAREANDTVAMWVGTTLPHEWNSLRIGSKYVKADINRRGRPCKGDSGGPLMQPKWFTKDVVAGVASNGTPQDVGNGQKCSKDGTDNFWTATGSKIGWIDQTVPHGCAFWLDVPSNKRYLDCTVPIR